MQNTTNFMDIRENIADMASNCSLEKLFSMYNVKSMTFSPPTVSKNAGEAEQLLIYSLLKEQNSMLFTFPDEFILYEIGSYDKSKGFIESYFTPIKVISGFEAVNRVNQIIEEERKRYEPRQQITNDTQNSELSGQGDRVCEQVD